MKLPALLLIIPALLFVNKQDFAALKLKILENNLQLENNDINYIDWSEKRLTWDDFLAEPVRKTDAAALTATHLGFSYNITNNKISYNIICRFDKTKSWGLVKNDWILKHEQGHFDIAEIFARKLFKEVSSYKFNYKSFQKDLDAIYKKVVAEKEVFQEQYDTETNYSRHKKNQEAWLEKIADEINQLQDFASYNPSLQRIKFTKASL